MENITDEPAFFEGWYTARACTRSPAAIFYSGRTIIIHRSDYGMLDKLFGRPSSLAATPDRIPVGNCAPRPRVSTVTDRESRHMSHTQLSAFTAVRATDNRYVSESMPLQRWWCRLLWSAFVAVASYLMSNTVGSAFNILDIRIYYYESVNRDRIAKHFFVTDEEGVDKQVCFYCCTLHHLFFSDYDQDK